MQGVFRHGTGVDMDLPRLGGLLSHLSRDVIEQFPEMVSVIIDADVSTIEVPRCHILEDKIPKLLHILLVTFRLGPEAALKLVSTSHLYLSLLNSPSTAAVPQTVSDRNCPKEFFAEDGEQVGGSRGARKGEKAVAVRNTETEG